VSDGIRKPSDKKRVLVADDDTAILEMFKLVLNCDLPDYRVDVAVNGQEVVDAFHDVHYGVIVLDIRMPMMNGDQAFEAIRKICGDQNLEMPAFIFSTGYDPPRNLENIVAAVPKHCILRKPVQPSVLVDALKARMDR
jgi:CheY-like chemotaxis protein